jgi:hypothetical protein
LKCEVLNKEIFGFIRPDVDAHTLGVSSVATLLENCGFKVEIGSALLAKSISDINKIDNISLLVNWIQSNGITRLGFSYRLDPFDAKLNFSRVLHLLESFQMLWYQNGPLNAVYFAGLPKACKLVREEYGDKIPVFNGDETQVETLKKIGIPDERIPVSILNGSKYDEERWKFASRLIASGKHHYHTPSPKPTYQNFGTNKDTLVERISANQNEVWGPLTRVHVGPYSPNYSDAKKEFNSWLKRLSNDGFLDIVSVGSSQLSQSDFGTDWGEKPNGGGVPINSEQDLRDIWDNSRPLLVRTYAGTKNIPELAKIYERTINMAWHALSFWWFNKIDGRGPYDVLTNLRQHFDTLKVIAQSGKPFEPNVPHHFAFRGADDFTYVLSGYLAVKSAKLKNIKYLVLQVMLNTPKYTFGVQDLAKSKALLKLVRELEDSTFKVFLQPRAGLDYFSPDLDKAKIQLASVSAMMDDIEPENPNSPELVHVVSYCEAVELANPDYINESIQITKSAILQYRDEKRKGEIDSMKNNEEVESRTSYLLEQLKEVIHLLENNIPNLYSPEGLYEVFNLGILPVPYLWEGREEFSEAIKWRTNLVNGGVQVIDENNQIVEPLERIKKILFNRINKSN